MITEIDFDADAINIIQMVQTDTFSYNFLPDQVKNFATSLADGKTLLLPTDTIWGIACDACNEEAVRKVYRLKQRELNSPFILLVDSLDMLRQYVTYIHPRIETLLVYHLRPLTIVYPQAKNLPSISISKNGSVAIRIVQDPFCRMLINQLGKPIVATSANVGDEPFPNHFGAVSSTIIQGVDEIVPYRQDEKELNKPSVIVSFDEIGELIFLRK